MVVALPGSASSVLADGVAFLQPADAVFEAMLSGWSVQQQSRLLAPGTIEKRRSTVERFAGFTNEFPWSWTVFDVEEWTSSMVTEGLSHSTIRNYQQSVSVFVGYVCDGRYDAEALPVTCSSRFHQHSGRSKFAAASRWRPPATLRCVRRFLQWGATGAQIPPIRTTEDDKGSA